MAHPPIRCTTAQYGTSLDSLQHGLCLLRHDAGATLGSAADIREFPTPRK
jgi:hypothetical protein